MDYASVMHFFAPYLLLIVEYLLLIVEQNPHRVLTPVLEFLRILNYRELRVNFLRHDVVLIRKGYHSALTSQFPQVPGDHYPTVALATLAETCIADTVGLQ